MELWTWILFQAHQMPIHTTGLSGRYQCLCPDLSVVQKMTDLCLLFQKVLNLVLVAFHACMATLTAASITPAYEDIALEFGKSVQSASYLTSLQIAILGGAPLFWKPLSNRFGRRPIFLLYMDPWLRAEPW